MKTILKTAMGAAAVAGLALAGMAEAKPRLTGEERLARLLEGRVAGKPVSCLTLSQARDVQVIDGTALVYGSGRTIYVNRTDFPRNLDSDDILVSKHHGSQACRLDLVRMLDRSGHVYTGFVSLGDFVPYRRVETAAR
jgi:hypothetical protein